MAESSSPPALPEDGPICSQATPLCRKQPSSLTGGQTNLQPSNPYLQKAAIQPYRRPTHTAAKHPNPAAEAYAAAGPIIRDYGITN